MKSGVRLSNPPQQPAEHVLHVITGKYFIDYIYRQDINNVFTKADVTYSYDWVLMKRDVYY